ncbi:MAG: hypothetical protein KKA73_01135 [Chloroflexi bacterium]|nr:hypothetical protein [Chloroflexota bacterium]MBU1746268.1 hypothetical protein [Chloroflexota bacterium]
MTERFGEVLESSTTLFTVGCLELYRAPALGSLIKARARLRHRVEEEPVEGWIYGLVAQVETGSDPPGGYVSVRSREGLIDEDIYREFPDLTAVMRTRLQALVVGFGDGAAIYHYLPPAPPPLHYSVFPCTDDEVRAFTERLTYLRMVLAGLPEPQADEVLAASVRAACQARSDPAACALQAGREVARLLQDDYERLRAILQRIQPV